MDDKGDNLYIWTHKKFEIGFNGKQVCPLNDVTSAITFDDVIS